MECWCQKFHVYQLVSEVGCLLGNIGNGTFISWCQHWDLNLNHTDHVLIRKSNV